MRRKNKHSGKLVRKSEKEKGSQKGLLLAPFVLYSSFFFSSSLFSSAIFCQWKLAKENTSRALFILERPSQSTENGSKFGCYTWALEAGFLSKAETCSPHRFRPAQSRHTSWFQASDPAKWALFLAATCPRSKSHRRIPQLTISGETSKPCPKQKASVLHEGSPHLTM